MAREKIITRTLVAGYKYEVISRINGGFGTIGEITTAVPMRSIKQTEEVLKENEYTGKESLVLLGTLTKKYKMSETDFLKYATEVVDDIDENQNDDESEEV